MDMNQFRKSLAKRQKLTEAPLATHTLTGTVYDVVTYHQPLHGEVARVYLHPVSMPQSTVALDACMVEVDLGQDPGIIQKGTRWSFEAQENPLASKPHWPAYKTLHGRKVP